MTLNSDKIILLKGQIRNDIRSIHYNVDKHLYDVVFNNGKRFSYNPSNVKELVRDEDITCPVRVIRKSDYLIFTDVIGLTTFTEQSWLGKKHEPLAYRVVFKDGENRLYTSDQIMIDRRITGDKPRDVFKYLRALADFSRIEIDDDTTIGLSMKYQKVAAVFESSPLSKYLIKDDDNFGEITCSNGIDADRMIFPFGCNRSQYQAVRNALTNKLSVIQGPPGTGKTQTILNIVANLLIAGKSVQIVSNNNSAVQNIADKLVKPEYHLEWLVAFLGRSSKKDAFYECQSGRYPDLSEWEYKNTVELRDEIYRISNSLLEGYDLQENHASYRTQLKDAQSQIAAIGGKELNPRTYRKLKDLSVISSLITQISTCHELGRKLPLFTRLKLKIWHIDADDVTTLEKLYYRRLVDQLNEKLENASAKIAQIETNTQLLQRKSLQYLHAILYNRYKKDCRPIYTRAEVEKFNPQRFLFDYPIVLSTTFSATSNICPTVPFDYLIMDEASQIDISAGALAMNCCRNAVIVGDTKQLPNVIDKQTNIAAEMLWRNFNLDEPYNFVNHSFLSSICDRYRNVPTTLLREHYRCAPGIIEFCNRQFYGGKLIAMTRDNRTSPVVQLWKTGAGNHARGHINLRQAEMIVKEIIPLVHKEFNDIGIIAPYNDQVREILNLLGPNSDIPVATVHKFQGRENDVVILSTVANQITPFIDDPHLLNVAVSRAKKLFILVISEGEQPDSNIKDLMDYILQKNGQVISTSIHSVFDMLYKDMENQRREFLHRHRIVSAVDSENLVFGLLEDIIAKPKFSKYSILCHYPLRCLITDDSPLDEHELKYARHGWTHLDFLIYNSTTRQPELAIEVDGHDYHFTGSDQNRRDAIKDSILKKIGLKLLRLNTIGSGEQEKIEAALCQSTPLVQHGQQVAGEIQIAISV